MNSPNTMLGRQYWLNKVLPSGDHTPPDPPHHNNSLPIVASSWASFRNTLKYHLFLWMLEGRVISWVLSHHNKHLKRRTSITALGHCYSSRTGQCYSSVSQLSFIQKIKENTSSRHEDMPTQKTRRGDRERSPTLWLLFLYVFSPPPGPALRKLGQPGGLFVLPEVLTPVFRPSFVLFSRVFPFLVFQPPPCWTPFSYSNYLT